MNKKTLLIIGGALALVVAAGLAERARGTSANTPTSNVQPEPQNGGSLNCSPVSAYVLTKRWVQHVQSAEQLTFPSFDEAFVQHDPAGDSYAVRAYYLVDGRKVGFYSLVRCAGDHWKTESLTVNGQVFNGSDEWV